MRGSRNGVATGPEFDVFHSSLRPRENHHEATMFPPTPVRAGNLERGGLKLLPILADGCVAKSAPTDRQKGTAVGDPTLLHKRDTPEDMAVLVW